MLHYSLLGAAFCEPTVWFQLDDELQAQAMHHGMVKVQDGGADEAGVLPLAFAAFAHP